MKFLKTLFVSAVLAVSGASAFAQSNLDNATGFVGASIGKIDGDNVDETVIGVQGTVHVPLESLEIQADAGFKDVDGMVLSVGGHLFTRNDERAFGGLLSFADNDDGSYWQIGGEYAHFLDNATIAANATYGSAEVGNADLDVINLGGQYRYFFSDSLRIDGSISWQKYDADRNDDSALIFGVSGEWLLEDYPISIIGGISRTGDNDITDSVTAFEIGGRYIFGAQDLKTRDRSGATWDPFGITGLFGFF